MRYTVSSCLLGVSCECSGGNNAPSELIDYLKKHEMLWVYPEVLDGLPTPRVCTEISGEYIMNTEGEDVTTQFKKGTTLVPAQIREFQPDLAVLQPRSPSYGRRAIYDGSFQNRLVEDDGVFARLLLDERIPVMTHGEFLGEVKPLSTKG